MRYKGPVSQAVQGPKIYNACLNVLIDSCCPRTGSVSLAGFLGESKEKKKINKKETNVTSTSKDW